MCMYVRHKNSQSGFILILERKWLIKNNKEIQEQETYRVTYTFEQCMFERWLFKGTHI